MSNERPAFIVRETCGCIVFASMNHGDAADLAEEINDSWLTLTLGRTVEVETVTPEYVREHMTAGVHYGPCEKAVPS